MSSASSSARKMRTIRKCPNCSVESPIGEFISCFICKKLFHTCVKILKNGKVDLNFIERSTLSGFKFICSECSPGLDSYSVTIAELKSQIVALNDSMSKIMVEIKKINDFNDIREARSSESHTTHEPLSTLNLPHSFANVVKESTLILTSKNPSIQKDQLKEKVRKSINPESNIIVGLHTTGSNKVILKSGNPDAAAFENSVKNKLGDDFEVEVHRNGNRRLKVIRFQNMDYTEEEIINAIIKQNIFMSENTKLLKMLPDRNNQNLSTLILETDLISHRNALEHERLSIKWNKFKVFDALAVNRCYKCSRFGHKINECDKSETCSKCSGPHSTKDCTSESPKCINCIDANNKYRLDNDVAHPAYSLNCPTMCHKLTKLRNSISRNQ
jgi:hypothetical protein